MEPQAIKDLNALRIRRNYRDWQPFIEKYNVQSICEIGVRASQNFRRMLAGKPKIAVGVDSWIEDGNPAHNDCAFPQEQLDGECEYFKSLMMIDPAIRLYRMYSHEAVKNFPDEYFDLIYIDADHSYEGIKQDLEDWWPKVKKGGFFTGDDYSNSVAKQTGVRFGVVKAVNEFAIKNGLYVHPITQKGWCIIK